MCKYILKHNILLNSTVILAAFFPFLLAIFQLLLSYSLGSKLQGMKFTTFFILARTAVFWRPISFHSSLIIIQLIKHQKKSFYLLIFHQVCNETHEKDSSIPLVSFHVFCTSPFKSIWNIHSEYFFL